MGNVFPSGWESKRGIAWPCHNGAMETRVFRAPGRVNLIGEHTDYNEGFVLPLAIDRYISVQATPRDDATVEVWSEEYNAGAEFPLETQRTADWTDYVRGVSSLLASRGLLRRGAALRIHSSLPNGAGLSSSAALEVSTAIALLGLNGTHLKPLELARLCQRAEHEFAGVRCGIMDQFIVTHACAGHGLLLDCQDLSFRHVPLPGGVRLVVANTMVKHELAGSAYGERRRQCEEAAHLLGARSLREVSGQKWAAFGEGLPEPVRSRARHIVEENDRVLTFAEALRNNDWDTAGQMMAGSHNSLRDLFEVSCPELDFMVEAGRELGSLGSRMTGGGFGGCTIHFVREADAASFGATLADRYRTHFGKRPQVFTCAASAAAAEV